MKKNCFNNIIGIFTTLLLLLLWSCRDSQPVKHTGHAHIDSTLLKEVSNINNRLISNVAAIKAEKGMKIFSVPLNGVINYDKRKSTTIASRVGGRIEQLAIRYNYQPVRKGQKIMEIYSPDLAAAQRELIYVARSGDNASLVKMAKQRLQLLGMRSSEIEKVMITGDVIYSMPVYSQDDGYISEAVIPEDGSAATSLMLKEGQYVEAGEPMFIIYASNNVVAEFAIPVELTSRIKKGQKILIHTQRKGEIDEAVIGLIEPVFRAGQSFSVARVYIDKNKYRAGQLVTANIPAVYNEGWWLPAEAVWNAGTRAVVFKKENGGFIPVEISVKGKINEFVQVTTDIDDWEIASNASYLADSESFITPVQSP